MALLRKSDDGYFLISELATKNLQTLLAEHILDEVLPRQQLIVDVMLHITKGLWALRESASYHGNLKLSNVLIFG